MYGTQLSSVIRVLPRDKLSLSLNFPEQFPIFQKKLSFT